jgi:hypothetical protein
MLSKLFANPVVQFFLDPVIPKLVIFYLQQYLNRWKKKGLIKNYKVEVQHLGKLYYKIGLHAQAVEKQTNIAVLNYISSTIEKMLKQAIK